VVYAIMERLRIRQARKLKSTCAANRAVRYGRELSRGQGLRGAGNAAPGRIIYSDPAEDGWRKGISILKALAAGHWRPARSVGYMFEFPGDPTRLELRQSCRFLSRNAFLSQGIVAVAEDSVTPLSYHDAWPVLQHLVDQIHRRVAGPLPFTYHVGPGPAS